MRRLLAVAGAFVLVGSMAGSSVAASGHQVVGAAWRLNPDGVPGVQFRVAAQVGTTTSIGLYQFANTGGFSFTGNVVCGAVAGGTAVIGGVITKAFDPAFVGLNFLVFFVDAGAPVFGSIGPDSVSLTEIDVAAADAGTDFPANFPRSCPAARGDTFNVLTGADGLRTVLGDVIVH